jgi:hypothetical protein
MSKRELGKSKVVELDRARPVKSVGTEARRVRAREFEYRYRDEQACTGERRRSWPVYPAGYLLGKLDREPSPMLLDFVLGPLQEEYLRRAMILADGDATVLVQRPLSAALLASAAALLGMVLLPSVRKRREEVFAEEEEGTKRRSIDFASHTPRAGAPGGTSANRGRLDAWLYQTGRPVAL